MWICIIAIQIPIHMDADHASTFGSGSALFLEAVFGSALEWKAGSASASQNSGAFEAQNGAVDGRGRSKWKPDSSSTKTMPVHVPVPTIKSLFLFFCKSTIGKQPDIPRRRQVDNLLGSLEGLGRVFVALGALPAVLFRLFRHSKHAKN